MKRPQIFLMGILCLLSPIILAQIPKAPENIQSPNVATFSQITENKISSFAGTIGIDIPICNITDGALNTQISTSYNTAGIRPDVHPGWLGLNTNLNVGGAITRTINDGPDDNNQLIDGKAVGFFYHPEFLNTTTWSTSAEIEYFADFEGADTEPDDFSFSINGLSGKFYMGENGQFRVQCDQHVKIERIGTTNEYYPPFSIPTNTGNNWNTFNNGKYMGHTAGFILTDESGTKYEFGGGDTNFMEYSIDFFNQGKDTWICNAWYLKSITHHAGQKTEYTYERGDFVAQMAVSVQNTQDITNGGGWWGESCDNNSAGLSSLGIYTGKLISPIYLKEIISQNTKIVFETSETTELKYDDDIFSTRITYETTNIPGHPPRSRAEFLYYLTNCYVPNMPYSISCIFDFTGGDPALLAKLKWRKLDTIKIFDTYASINILKKKIAFTYNNAASERLMLQKIQEIGENSTDKINPYEFYYKKISGRTLPNYLKSHTDHWGFNNAKPINISNDFSNFTIYGNTYRSPAIGAEAENYLVDLLEKIKYPTGGFTEFTFEPHTYSKEANIIRSSGFSELNQNVEAGGVRIKKTKTYEQNTNCPAIEKEYLYLKNFNPENPNQTLFSSGILGGKSQYYWQNYRPKPEQGNYSYTKNVFSTQSVLPASENGVGTHIGYSEIIEKSPTGGWSVFKYSNYDTGLPASQFWDEPAENTLQETATAYEPNNSRSFMRGKMIENTIFNQLGKAVVKTKTNYSLLITSFAKAMRTFRKPLCATSIYVYEGTAYKMYTTQYKITSETTEIFNQNNVAQSVISLANYAYNAFGQVNEIKKSQSDGSEIIARTKYVPEYVDITGDNCRANLQICLNACGSDGFCQGQCYATYNACLVPMDDASFALLDLKNRHIWWPVETINYRKKNGIEQIIGANISVPGYFGGRSMPYKGYKLHLSTPLASNAVSFSSINTSRQFTFNSLYNQPEITFDSYNNEGNPTQFTARNGLITSYAWGYKNRLPIAEIKNETYSNVASALGGDESLLLNTVVSEADIRTKINAIRSTTDRKVSTYTHDVIFGVKSITDPAGINTLFNYDGLGKLKSAVDNHGYIVKDIRYQYAGQAVQTDLGATPTNTINYIATRVPRTAQSNISTDINLTNTNIQYVDGLGRVAQALIWKGSPDQGSDIINSTNVYDLAGRNNKVILPTKSDGVLGQYKANAGLLAQSFYTDTVARNETIFEGSPLSRPAQQYGPGQDWRVNPKHPQSFFYETTGSTVIPLYTADENGIIKGSSNYPLNQLFITRVLDELGNEVAEIKDTDGKIIQKRITNDGSELLITHYVYNDLNQLKAVIQPNAYPLSNDVTKTADNIFFYNYDTRGRIIEKKVPGADVEYFVYDFWDRLVLSQTALQRYENKWTFYKYDALNREILRGEKAYSATDTQESLQNSAMEDTDHHEVRDDNASPIYYGLSTTFPSLNYSSGSSSSDYVYQINYYDYYGNWASGIDFVSAQISHSPVTLNGSLTGTKVLANPGLNNDNWLRMANYYDYKNRLIQSRKEHLMATVADVCSYEYNFAGELLQKKIIHKQTDTNNNTSDLNEVVTNTLDHMGRITQITHTIGSVTKTISAYEYDNIGRMKTKNLGIPANFQPSSSRQSVTAGDWTNIAVWENNQLPGTNSLVEIAHLIKIPAGITVQAGDVLVNPNTLEVNGILNLNGGTTTNQALQKLDYKYHIRGSLLGINLDASKNANPSLIEKDMFSYKLDYDFDFNIKKQSWKHQGSDTLRNYTFTYDKSHRLKSAIYSNFPTSLQDFSIPLINYDKNGNITNLQRKGKKGGSFGLIDDLTYNYNNTNRLGSVTDQEAGTTYEVDLVPRGNNSYTYANDGSLKSDANEGINDINYNTFLRQPNYITLTNGGRIDYIYSGAGVLLKTSYSGPITEEWNYAENIIYKGTDPFSINTSEGRATYQNNTWEFEYFITDHLGNVRVSFKDVAGVATKTAVTDRDPLGVILKNTAVVNGFQNRNEFQGKASELTYGLNRIDLGARTMNPTIGRMDRVDNFSEKYSSLSSFQFAGNNGLVFKEINGDSLDVFELLQSKSHAAAFALFATSSLGKSYLSKYASKGQKIEINGKLIFEATADGANHKKGINLRYSLNNSKGASKETSITLTSPNMANSMDLNFFIADRGFGSSNRIFDLTKAIVHESFIHGELEQQDFDDDGNFYNQSNLKSKNYVDDHDAVSKNYNSTTNLWPKGAEEILQRANGIIKSGLTNAQIKNIIWSFAGSNVSVNPISGEIKQK